MSHDWYWEHHQTFPMTSSTKMMVTSWLGILPMWDFQACLHVRYISLSVIKPLLRSHHSLSFNHWRMKRAEEKRKEAHDVIWVCVLWLSARTQGRVPSPDPFLCVKQLLPSPPGVCLTQTKVPWTDLTTCYCNLRRQTSATGILVHQIFYSISFS